MIKKFLEKTTGRKPPENSGGGEKAGGSAESVFGPATEAKKKGGNLLTALLCAGAIALAWVALKSGGRGGDTYGKPESSKAPIKLEVASASLDAEKMWRNRFEDKLSEAAEKADEKLALIEASVEEKAESRGKGLEAEIEKLKEQIRYLSEEQALSRRELGDAAAKLREAEEGSIDRGIVPEESRITVNSPDREESFDRPKSSRNYIPETAYVKAVLLGGIAVSTSIGSSSEPVPVIARITGRGNLPKNFAIDLTRCRIMGSAYGDLSSERAVVRAEVLSCGDPETETVYTTKVAGVIYGDDGMNGIKGRVVQTSGKHLKNALAGSLLSGLAGAAKGQDSAVIGAFGAASTKKKDAGDMLREGSYTGAANAAERIADYYIRQAEAMSPVLFVPGGTAVDVVFTKGVYFGSLDVREKLESARIGKEKK